MKRRDLIASLAAMVAASPFALRAQGNAMPVVGFLSGGWPNARLEVAFRQGLGETGFVEGQNLAIEYRWAEGNYDRLPALAADLVRRRVEVIATFGGPPPTLAAKAATATIPIVFSSADPVGQGLVDNLARPAGNLTGFSLLSVELMPKQVELLSELAPSADGIALLVNPNNPITTERTIREVEKAAHAKGLQLHVVKASSENEMHL